MAEQIMWAVASRKRILSFSVKLTRREAIDAATTGRPWAWPDYERRGYRCIRVKVVEVQDA